MAVRFGDWLAKHSSIARSINLWNRRRINRLREKRISSKSDSYEKKLAVLAIMKNESLLIKEWIQHYLDEGADEIYIIDNGSDDNSKEIIESFSSTGKVQYIFLPKKWHQKEHYWSTLRKHKIKERFEWLLIADVDEFWFVKDGRTVADALSSFCDFDVIYGNWSIFGSSGFEHQPASVRSSFVLRQPLLGSHKFTKWICRTSSLRKFSQLQVHKIKGACSSRTVSANETFQVNHYMIQSREYFEKVKMARGDVNNPIHDQTRNWSYFEGVDEACTLRDSVLSDRVEEKRILEKRTIP